MNNYKKYTGLQVTKKGIFVGSILIENGKKIKSGHFYHDCLVRFNHNGATLYRPEDNLKSVCVVPATDFATCIAENDNGPADKMYLIEVTRGKVIVVEIGAKNNGEENEINEYKVVHTHGSIVAVAMTHELVYVEGRDEPIPAERAYITLK